MTVRTCELLTSRSGSAAVKRKKSMKEVWFMRIILAPCSVSPSQSPTCVTRICGLIRSRKRNPTQEQSTENVWNGRSASRPTQWSAAPMCVNRPMVRNVTTSVRANHRRKMSRGCRPIDVGAIGTSSAAGRSARG